MRVLMFGWEFPPYMSGGLGTACKNISEALSRRGTEVLFVMPDARFSGKKRLDGRVELCSASGRRLPAFPRASGSRGETRLEKAAKEVWENRLQVRCVKSLLFPYATPETYLEYLDLMAGGGAGGAAGGGAGQDRPVSGGNAASGGPGRTVRVRGGYGPDLMSEVYRYSLACAAIAAEEDFDVIHAHDWMTYPAGMLAARITGKPLVVHMHAMEHDRSGDNVNHEVARIEKAGLEAAHKVAAVSHYTKNLIKKHYGTPDHKIAVVHNAVSRDRAAREYRVPELSRDEKRVLFMGRVTFQKGPEYFVEAARLVLEKMPGVRFVMAGTGDMLARMVRRVAELRLGSRFHFTGFLHGEEVDRMYAMSDLYVMPSVSEPFGIAPLEAMIFDTPVLITRQSGVSEVINNALKVDFWDVRGMADKICAVLSSSALSREMVVNCREELKAIKWEDAADKLNAIYDELARTY